MLRRAQKQKENLQVAFKHQLSIFFFEKILYSYNADENKSNALGHDQRTC